MLPDLAYNKRSEAQKIAQVRWYWQSEEVPKQLRKMLNAHKMAENEVILDLSDKYEREIDLETVVGKCKVCLYLKLIQI